MSSQRQKQLTSGKGDAILKGIVKQFFNEKEVTSTLVMDALFCGCRQLDKLGRDRVRTGDCWLVITVVHGIRYSGHRLMFLQHAP